MNLKELAKRVEQKRDELTMVINKNGSKILSTEKVIEISQQLDELLADYQRKIKKGNK